MRVTLKLSGKKLNNSVRNEKRLELVGTAPRGKRGICLMAHAFRETEGEAHRGLHTKCPWQLPLETETPPTVGWTHGLWFIHTTPSYLATKRNELLINSTNMDGSQIIYAQ